MKFCVIGLGRFGYHVSETLAQHNMEVLAIDSNEALVASIRDTVTQAVCMDVQDEESLHAVGIEDVDIVIVAMGENVEQSILLTALLKKHLHVPTVIARASTKIHETILKLVGADQVVSPERDQGIRLANNLSFPFTDFINVTDTFSITLLAAPQTFVGKSLEELQLRINYNVDCIGVKKGDSISLVSLNYVVLDGDMLVFAGENQHLESLSRL